MCGLSSRGNASEATGKFSPRARFATEATSSIGKRSRLAGAQRNFHAFVAPAYPTRAPSAVTLKLVGGSRPAPNLSPPKRTGRDESRPGFRGVLLRPPPAREPTSLAVRRPYARAADPTRS